MAAGCKTFDSKPLEKHTLNASRGDWQREHKSERAVRRCTHRHAAAHGMVRSAAKPSEKLRVLQMQWNTLLNGYEIQFAGKQPASLATLTAHLKHNVANSWPPRLRIRLTQHVARAELVAIDEMYPTCTPKERSPQWNRELGRCE